MSEKFPALAHFLHQLAAGADLEEDEQETITVMYPHTPASSQLLADIKRERETLEKELGAAGATNYLGQQARRSFDAEHEGVEWLDRCLGILQAHLGTR